jgi:hypothetical protein
MSQTEGQERCFSGDITVRFSTGIKVPHRKRKIHTLHLTNPGLRECTTKRQAKKVARETAVGILRRIHGKDFGLKEATPVEIRPNA